MVTVESFTDDPDQVEHLIKWWISQADRRYSRVVCRGSIRDFINDVWVRLLVNFRDGKQVDCGLATAVISHCGWTLYGLNHHAKTYREVYYKILTARRIKSDDRIGGSGEAEEYAYAAEKYANAKHLDRVIARVLVSLPFREAIVVRARFGLLGDKPLTLAKVASAMKVSVETIRKLETKALCRLRHHSRARRLLPFADVGAKPHEQKDHGKLKQMQKSEYGQVLLEELMQDVV